MAEIIDFEGKKLDDDDEIFDSLLIDVYKKEVADKNFTREEMEEDLRRERYPERVVRKILKDLFGGDKRTEATMNNVVPLKKKFKKSVDWDEVEAIRNSEYPRIPKKVIAIIRMIFEGKDGYLDVFQDGGDYPPDPIPVAPVQGDALWIMDLLDRYGGEVRFGNKQCVIRRKKKRPALFKVQRISLSTREALIEVLGHEFEHFLQSKSWTIIGKEATVKLMVLIITHRQDEDRIYLGLCDRQTASVLFRRMKSLSIESVLGI
jgi:hypothetical protein